MAQAKNPPSAPKSALNMLEMTKRMRENLGMTQKQAQDAYDFMIKQINDEVGEGNTVQLVGLGTWKVSPTKERVGRNPQSNEPMTIPAGLRVSFKPGKTMAEGLKQTATSQRKQAN